MAATKSGANRRASATKRATKPRERRIVSSGRQHPSTTG